MVLLLLTQSYLLISPFVYSGAMVIWLNPSLTKSSAGYYAGLVASSFMFGRTISSYQWGKWSDVYGRRAGEGGAKRRLGGRLERQLERSDSKSNMPHNCTTNHALLLASLLAQPLRLSQCYFTRLRSAPSFRYSLGARRA